MKMRIDEYAGVFNNWEDMAERILKSIYRYWFDENGKILDNIDFCFRLRCPFGNDGFVSICPTKFNVSAAYILDTSKVNGDSVIIINPEIVNPHLNIKDDESLMGTLTHELTHMYRDTMKRRNGTSELEAGHKEGYFKAFDYYFREKKPIKLKKDISDFLYVTSQMEIPAYFAGMYGILSRNKYKIKTTNDALLVLYNTKYFKRFSSLFYQMKRWFRTTDAEQQKLLVQYLDELAPVRIRTFGQFKKFIQKRYDRCNRKIKQLIPKMVAKLFEEN